MEHMKDCPSVEDRIEMAQEIINNNIIESKRKCYKENMPCEHGGCTSDASPCLQLEEHILETGSLTKATPGFPWSAFHDYIDEYSKVPYEHTKQEKQDDSSGIVLRVWCNTCDDFVEDFKPSNFCGEWLCCSKCGTGLISVVTGVTPTVEEFRNSDREHRVKIAKAMWGL